LIKGGFRMTDQKEVDLDDIFSQIDEFEKTITQLNDNLKNFREKLLKNREKFGPDMSKWPAAAE